MALITYEDKVALNENPNVPDVNKVNAGDMNQIKNAINNLIWPVGSYYETSDTTFNPNTTWGGTWVLDSSGKVTVSQDTNDTDFDTLGETGGEKTHTLTVDEMPSHNHSVTNYSIAGRQNRSTTEGGNLSFPNDVGNITIGNKGGGQSHNNLQPYIVVKRWHRTA